MRHKKSHWKTILIRITGSAISALVNSIKKIIKLNNALLAFLRKETLRFYMRQRPDIAWAKVLFRIKGLSRLLFSQNLGAKN